MDKSYSKSAADEEPIYNIGVVSRMTGIPVATLRVWERRYDFPNSTRTPGGHRLYTEKELVRLRWVKANIDQGMQTSQAVRALRSRERVGRIPELVPAVFQPPARPATNGSALSRFHERLTGALLNHDLDQADRLLGEILAIYPLEDLILQVIRPALADIGEGWEKGRVNVATEHFASQYLRNRLMTWLVTGPPTHPVRPVVLACAPDDWHEIGLMMLGVMLRRRRWPIAYLGQSVPLSDLAKFVREIRPSAVVIVAMTEDSAQRLVDLPKWLPEVAAGAWPILTYAGLPFNQQPELQEKMTGTFLGETLTEAVETLERALLDATALSM